MIQDVSEKLKGDPFKKKRSERTSCVKIDIIRKQLRYSEIFHVGYLKMTIKKGEDDDKIHVGFWGYPTKNPKGHLDLDESLAERIRAMKPQSSVEKQIRMDGWMEPRRF